MTTITEFTEAFINDAISLWQTIDHIGLNEVDDQPEAIIRFLKHNKGCSFVATHRDALVGTCLCGHDSRRGTIYHLAVHSDHRRSGIGQALLATAMDALASAGVTKCHAHVFADNPYGAKFWVPNGWLLRSDLCMYSAYTNPPSS